MANSATAASGVTGSDELEAGRMISFLTNVSGHQHDEPARLGAAAHERRHSLAMAGDARAALARADEAVARPKSSTTVTHDKHLAYLEA